MSTKTEYNSWIDPVVEASISSIVDEFQAYDEDGGPTDGEWNIANNGAPVQALVRTSEPLRLAWVIVSGTGHHHITHIAHNGDLVADTAEELQDFIEKVRAGDDEVTPMFAEGVENVNEVRAEISRDPGVNLGGNLNGGPVLVREMPSDEEIESAREYIAGMIADGTMSADGELS